MAIRLRYMLAAAFIVVATVPVFYLGLWVERTAMDREISAVREKHLLLAGNMTAALERYAKDARATFDTLIRVAAKGDRLHTMADLVRQLGFRHFCVFDHQGQLVSRINLLDGSPALDGALLAELTAGSGEDSRFSPVRANTEGQPAIFLTRRLAGGQLAIAELSTDYHVRLQKAIAFGRKGHAAIVDRQGNIIAHPNPAWRMAMKNIAKVEPVKQMMAGGSGVTNFYSPALKKDMVSGYTTVPETGWGVMVPQPIEELEERAGEVKAAALSLIVAGLFIAAILGWFLAGVLIRPVEAVLTAAREIANGRLQARVRRPDRLTPTEFRELATDFNEMATRIESANEKMVAAVERARRADTAKSTFLANMSHEFRTPLNAIIGFADMMRSELLGPIGNRRYRDYAGDIMVSGEHLLDVVNGILDLSKIEAGKMELEDDAVDLPTVLREAQTLVEDDARKAELNLRLEIEAELPAVRGSAVKLKQVALNLLSNATRFTPAGGDVVLSARQEIEGDIVIRCRDTGIGMNEEEIEQSLTPFTQVDGELSRKYEGTGLGLPLARRLVELHDGRLEIESIPHQGTTVTVRLPRKRVGPRAEPQDQAIAAVKGEAAASR